VINVLPSDLKSKIKDIPEVNPELLNLTGKLLFMESEIMKVEANTLKMDYKSMYDSSKQLYFGLELISNYM